VKFQLMGCFYRWLRKKYEQSMEEKRELRLEEKRLRRRHRRSIKRKQLQQDLQLAKSFGYS
jgi:regulator of replication initiation timing